MPPPAPSCCEPNPAPTDSRASQRPALPAATFFLVFLVHFAWTSVFPEGEGETVRWALPAGIPTPSYWERYIETQAHYLGFSYALALAFAAWALRRYRETRLCAARNLAIGGVSFSGALAVATCYLLGCCGSPMIVVYLSLFGTGFLPFARPLIALLTLLSISAAWWWLLHDSKPPEPTSP